MTEPTGDQDTRQQELERDAARYRWLRRRCITYEVEWHNNARVPEDGLARMIDRICDRGVAHTAEKRARKQQRREER